MASERDLLRQSARHLLANDPAVAERARDLLRDPALQPALEGVRAKLAGGGFEVAGADGELGFETVVNRVGRPVLLVRDGDYVLDGPEAAVWRQRLGGDGVRRALRAVIASVGRVEVENHPTFTWLGTGWVVGDDVVVTNRHVAGEFCTRGGDGFVFRRGWPDAGRRMAARLDFQERPPADGESPGPRFRVVDVLHVEDDDGPDLAFLRVTRDGPAGVPLAPPLRLAGGPAAARQYVATVGYPAADSRVPDQDLVRRLFGDVYNVKRLAPGQVGRSADDLVTHDCSTLGGNSGSPIVDLESGDVVGLHFSGLFLRENRGVPAPLLAARLDRLRRGPGRVAAGTQVKPVPPPRDPEPPPTPAETRTATATVPGHVTITVTVTVPAAAAAAADDPAAPPARRPGTASLDEAVREARDQLGGRPGVLAVRDGYVFRDDWITDERAVVVVLRDAEAIDAGAPGLPRDVLGFPVEVRAPGPWDFAEARQLLETLEGLPRTAYRKPDGLRLRTVEDAMKVVCHVSPDAGWPTLRRFLAKTRRRLTVGMYNFTAPHIIDAVAAAVADAGGRLSLVLHANEALAGRAKKDDIPEEDTVARFRKELGDRFRFAWSSVGRDRQFASAYHIKVAVRDGKAFWLSSGNWQSSNQPNREVGPGETSWDLLLGYNRDWHVVVGNRDLARQLEDYLKYDLEQATRDAEREAVAAAPLAFFVSEAPAPVPPGAPTYFPPLRLKKTVRVRPLLTPDNYQESVLGLLEKAEQQILFQNQSFTLLDSDKNDARFAALAGALLDRQRRGLDVRLIIRGDFYPARVLEQLRKQGFDMGRVRLQNHCHTKGVVVDNKRVLIGSHNWTNQGTLANRDASLIFDDAEVAGYYARVFQFDWERLARRSVGGGRRVRVAGDGEAPAGMARVPWHALLLD